MGKHGAWRRAAIGLTVGVGVLTGAQYLHSATVTKADTAKVDASIIDKRLTQLLENQRTILKKLDAISEELRIIKIRATR